MNNQWSYQSFNLGRLIYPWLRPERIVMILTLVSFMRDDFKSQYEDNADVVFIVHCIVIVVCVFADCIKKKIDTSSIKVGNVEIKEEEKTRTSHSHTEKSN
jgi:hypothetical protein